MEIELPDLLKTSMHLIGLLGSVEDHGDHLVARTPSNPGFYHGNFLFLPGPPEDLERWMARFEEVFDASVEHRCFEWVGGALSDAASARAEELGLLPDAGVGLALDAPPETPRISDGTWSIRPLDPVADGDRFEVLNIRCDPAEAQGPATYQEFKRRIRATLRAWMAGGMATWWGAFDGDELVGQCGFVVVGDLGRFQAVETHPDRRRQGVCSSLIAHVARDGFERLGCRRVLLEADGIGPAVGLYRRLGFVEDAGFHSLVRPSEPLVVRAEAAGQHADVRSLLRAAFPKPGESELVEQLRETPGAISLVAVQSGAVVGHILFTPVRVRGGASTWPAVALGPMAVRPDRQRRGVGTELMQAGLEACREAGHEACFVLGHPWFYPRAGFRPASPLGLSCEWDVPDEIFMVLELQPDGIAGRKGRVEYHPAFHAL